MSDNYLSFQKALLIALRNEEEATGEQNADLLAVCSKHGLPQNEDWLVRFINENSLWGSGSCIGEHYHFSLNTNGLHYAVELREQQRPKSFFEKAKNTGPEWYAVGISLLSLGVSLAALFRENA